VKVGDLVADDRSHMDESNLFWGLWRRCGVVIEVLNPKVVVVMWQKNGKVWRQNIEVSKLEMLNESR